MPIETTLWNVTNGFVPITYTAPETEMDLENILFDHIDILDPNFLVIGHQITTDYGGRIDILAMDVEGNLVVIELKRDRTPRDVVSQILDYASWIQDLAIDDVRDVFRQYNPNIELEQKYSEEFETEFPEALNENHRLIIVASELDNSTERILRYLSENYGVPINVVFFRYFKQEENRFLSRTWMVDPEVVERQVGQSRTREQWNQKDFYVSFGADDHRDWEDAQKFGFVSAGHGEWYTRTLKQLFAGARVFAYIPQEGYVGVGTVVDTVKPINEFIVERDGVRKPLLEWDLRNPNIGDEADDPERSEQLVKIDWIKTVPQEDAFREPGLFANQNTVCKLKNKFTLEKLYKFFNLDD